MINKRITLTFRRAVLLAGLAVAPPACAGGLVQVPLPLKFLAGADATGATDSSAAFRAACLNGGYTTVIPAGSYKITAPASGTFCAVTGGFTHWDGGDPGATTITVNAVTSTGFRKVIENDADDTAFTGLTFNYVGVAGDAYAATLFYDNANRLRLDRVTVNGGVAQTGSSYSGATLGLNWLFYPLQYGSTGSQSNTVVERSTFAYTGYVGLKNNTDTSTQNGIRFSKDTFSHVFGGLMFNSPNGACSNIQVDGNTFDTDGWSLAAGAQQFLLSIAGCVDADVYDNHFYGATYQAIHTEETTGRLHQHDNTFYVAATQGELMIPNNISEGGTGGTTPTPIAQFDLDIHDEVFVNTGTQAAGVDCLNLGTDTTHGPGAIRSKVHDIKCINWSVGIDAGATSGSATAGPGLVSTDGGPEIYDNTVLGALQCYRFVYAYQGIHDNTCQDSTAGFAVAWGGTLGFQRFDNVVVPFVSNAQVFGISGFVITLPVQTHPCGTSSTTNTYQTLFTNKVDFLGSGRIAVTPGAATPVGAFMGLYAALSLLNPANITNPASPAPAYSLGTLTQAYNGGISAALAYNSPNVQFNTYCNSSTPTSITREARFDGVGLVYP